jgi:hypothetical protein
MIDICQLAGISKTKQLLAFWENYCREKLIKPGKITSDERLRETWMAAKNTRKCEQETNSHFATTCPKVSICVNFEHRFSDDIPLIGKKDVTQLHRDSFPSQDILNPDKDHNHFCCAISQIVDDQILSFQYLLLLRHNI